MKHAVTLFVLLLASTAALHGAEPRKPQAILMTGVEVPTDKVFSQALVSSHIACVPTTFLNALRFGPERYQQVLARIPGESDRDKLAHVILKRGSLPSSVEPERSLFFKEGVSVEDILTYFKSILGEQFSSAD